MGSQGQYTNIHQRLIDRCRRGDSNAQFQIYKLYYRAMYNTSLRIVEREVEAEDIMQEAFLKAFQRIGSYSNSVSFGAWLKRIVVNASLDWVKRKKLPHTQLYETYAEEEQNTNDEVNYKSYSIEQVKQAIERLPTGFKLVVNLVLVEGYSHQEAGEMLGITASSSRSQLARAKQRIVETLKSELVTKEE